MESGAAGRGERESAGAVRCDKKILSVNLPRFRRKRGNKFFTSYIFSMTNNIEITFLRLAILLSLLSFICLSGYGGYLYTRYKKCNKMGESLATLEIPNSNPSQRQLASALATELNKRAIKYRENSVQFIALSIGIPFIIFILYYSIRWVILGRFFPLWPVSSSEKGTNCSDIKHLNKNR